ncbi:MAG: carboxypeptidase-like regulatory domain-containing protein [Acidobacteriota bacterium]|nr:carboxypeptidase-like regulatory domain-containing protein [Acidobacteriota bacterium]
MKAGWLTLAMLSLRLTAQGPVYSKQPAQPQTGKASIEGTVIDAGTREPVKKASVMLMGRFSLNAITDASGHFAFRQLPAGQYSIQAQSEKYPPAQPGGEGGHFLAVPLAADEQKRDVNLTLTPGAAIRGRLVDDEGSPMPGCSVTAMQFREVDAGRTLQGANWGTSDGIGEYLISRVRPGKYYIMAHCYRAVTLPHAFIRRSDAMDAPVLTYAPQFYPGAPDPAGATRVEAQANANISGIDFRMPPATGVTVRGHAGPPPPDQNLQIELQPKDVPRREWQQQIARVNGSTGQFRFPNVTPGLYELTAMGTGDGHSYFGRVQIEVGATPLDPIKVELSAAPSISGSISIEGNVKVPITNLVIRMDPLEAIVGDPSEAAVQSDGTYTFKSIVPGHWRLSVSNAPGYLKSVMRGDQEVSGEDLEIGPAGALLKIVIGTNLASMNVGFSAPPAEPGQYSAMVWREHGYRDLRVLGQQGPTTIGVPPGKYHVCGVTGGQQSFALMQNHALLRALESVCETVEVGEGGSASVQMRLVTSQELTKMAAKLEE